MRLRTLPSDHDQAAGELPRRPRSKVPSGHEAPPSATGPMRPHGGAVADAVPTPIRRSPTSDLQRTAVRGGCIGALAGLTVVTAAVALNGGGLGSIGAGIMVAGFDGIPFGAMIGAMIHFMRHPEEQ